MAPIWKSFPTGTATVSRPMPGVLRPSSKIPGERADRRREKPRWPENSDQRGHNTHTNTQGESVDSGLGQNQMRGAEGVVPAQHEVCALMHRLCHYKL